MQYRGKGQASADSGAARLTSAGYFGVSDLLSPAGGIRAVNLATGAVAWSVEPQEGCAIRSGRRAARRRRRGHGDPRRVFLGIARWRHARLLDEDGSILWTFDTTRSSRRQQCQGNGGGLEGPGAIVSGGMLYFNSATAVRRHAATCARLRHRLIVIANEHGNHERTKVVDKDRS